MKFEKGKEKTGGRQKGTPNKITRIEETLKMAGVDVWQTFAEDWFKCDHWQRMQIRRWIADYQFTKPRPDDDGQSRAMPSEEQVAILARYIKS